MIIRESKTDRQERILHFSQDVIRNTKIVVIGAGATGNEVLKCLALTGFGYVYVTDMDHISTSNLSRTVLFSEADIGRRKSSTAAERFCAMHIDHGKADFFDGDICHGMGEGVLRRADIVIGCVDNEQTRLFISNLCQFLGKPYIDTGIGEFNWNIFTASGQPGCPCYACTLSPRSEAAALSRIRNSCDVTRRKAAREKLVPTIGISAAAVAALAVQEAIKISHHLKNPNSGLATPRYGWLSCFTAEENTLTNIPYQLRDSCEHHDNYDNYGGVQETPMSARWTLRDVLSWVSETYQQDYDIALYKDNACADRGFVTTGSCTHCGAPMDIYRPQPLQDEDILCDRCRGAGRTPERPSGASIKNYFTADGNRHLLDMTLLELGIPLFHILEFFPCNGGESLFLELTGDLPEVMPNLPT